MQLIAQSRQALAGMFAATGQRSQTRTEEKANRLSHSLGLAAAVAAGVWLLVTASQRGNSAFSAGASVHVASRAALYLASSL